VFAEQIINIHCDEAFALEALVCSMFLNVSATPLILPNVAQSILPKALSSLANVLLV
jgi:hypothetical protein